MEEKEITRRERQYDSEVKKKADADRYAKEQEAQAQKAKEVTGAGAERLHVEALAETEANETGLAGRAKTEAALAKGKTEAGAKQEIANAFKEYGEAVVLSVVVDMLPQLMHGAIQPLGNIEKVSAIDTGNSSGETNGVSRVANYATDLLSTTQETLKAAVGLDLREIVENLSTRGTTSQVSMYGAPKEAEQHAMKEE